VITLLATLRFTLVSAVQNFWRNLAVSLAATCTMGAILLFIGGILLGTHMLNQMLTAEQAKASNIKIYLEDGVSLGSIANLQSELRADPRVSAVHFENKDDAAKEASSQVENFSESLKVLGSNPLPASLNLDLHRLADLPAIDTMARRNAIVQRGNLATDYNPAIIDKLQTLITWAWRFAVGFLIVFGTLSVVIIMISIRTAVLVRRREVEIMKLVGATDWFVRGPFILEGVIGGVIAAAISGTVIAAAYKPAVDHLRSTLFFFPLSYDGSYLAVVALLLFAAGIGLGAFGSYLGVRRFLTV